MNTDIILLDTVFVMTARFTVLYFLYDVHTFGVKFPVKCATLFFRLCSKKSSVLSHSCAKCRKFGGITSKNMSGLINLGPNLRGF